MTNLPSFDEFAGDEILGARDYQDYQSYYLDLYANLRLAAEAEKAKAQQEALEAQIKAATEKAAKKDDGSAPKPDAK